MKKKKKKQSPLTTLEDVCHPQLVILAGEYFACVFLLGVMHSPGNQVIAWLAVGLKHVLFSPNFLGWLVG